MKKLISILCLLASSYSVAGTLGQYTSNSDGFDTHTYYYDDGEEVVLIDTQFIPTITQQFVEYVKIETDTPITKVIVTHPNPDKFNGLSYLHRLGIQSISSRKVAEDMIAVNQYKRNFWINQMGMFTEESYPKFEEVQWQFTGDKAIINLNSGETLSLFKLQNPGIASSQIVVKVDDTGDLIVGDLVHYKAHAWLEGPLVDGQPQPMLQSWIKALDELYEFTNKKALVYGGRGEISSLQVSIKAQQDYLNRAEDIVESYVAYSDFENKSQNVDDVVALFETEFPDYELPYMIKYSVQPLLNQKR